MATVQISIDIDSELKARIYEDEARQTDSSSSYIVVRAIMQYINNKDNKNHVLEKAIQKADKGGFISQELMREWFASLGAENELSRPKPDVFLNRSD